MKIYHPDAGGNEETTQKINVEYNTLKAKCGLKRKSGYSGFYIY